MSYIVASEGSRDLPDRSVQQRRRATPVPTGTAHLFTDGEGVTLCGRPVDGLFVFRDVPVPGKHVRDYGCPVCKDAAAL